MRLRAQNAYISITYVTFCIAGCANPGPPKAPSLHLPQKISDLSAQRQGDLVAIRFTAPVRTTDNEPLPPGIRVEICRSVPPGSCATVLSRELQPEVNELTDPLPEALRGGPAAPLEYRVQLVNSSKRTAGWSSPAISAAGEAPTAITGPKVALGDGGTLLTWNRSSEQFDEVVMARQEPASPGQKQAKASAVKVSAVAGDPGGAIDPAGLAGHKYLYELRRVRRVTLNGHTVEISSAPVKLETDVLRDTTPPSVPAGLEVLSSTDGIALSWQPNHEADLAGYVIYRSAADGGEWQPLNPQPQAAPQFSDATAAKGSTYSYAITAVDNAGNESAKSPAISQKMQ